MSTISAFKPSLLKTLLSTILLSTTLAVSTAAVADSCACSNHTVETLSIEESNDTHVNQLTLMTNSTYYKLLDQNNTVLQNRLYEVVPYPDGRILAKRDGKYGVINNDGKLIFDFIYDDIAVLSNDLYLLSDYKLAQSNNVGYANALVKGAKEWLYPASGKFEKDVAIEQLYYDDTNSIGYFKTTENGKFGLINDKKQSLLSNRYDALDLLDTCPNERLFMSVKAGNKTGLVDQNQNFVVPMMSNQSIENFNEEEQVFRVSRYYVDAYNEESTIISEKLIKGKGQMLIESDSPMVSIADSLYRYSVNNKYGIINDKGEVVVPAQFEYLSYNSYSPLVVTKNAKQGIVQPSADAQKLVVNTYYDQLQEAYIEDKNLAQLQLSEEELAATEVSDTDEDAYSEDTVAVDYTADAVEDDTDSSVQPLAEQYEFSDRLYIAQNDSKFGLIDSKDNIRIPFLYDQMSVSLGALLVKKNQKYGLLTTHNETVAGVFYDQIEEMYRPQYESVYKVTQNNQQGIIDTKGKKLFALSAYQIIDKSDDGIERYVIRGSDGKYGLLDERASSVLIPARYESIEQELANKNIIAQSEGKKVLLDSFGQVVPSDLSQYTEIYEMYANDNLKVVDQKGKQGIISADGKLIIKPLYDTIDAIAIAYYADESTDYYMIEVDERYGLLDTKGKMLVKPEYASLNPLGYLPFIVASYYDSNMEDVKEGLINAKGQVVKKMKYDNIYESYYDEDQQIVLIMVADDKVEIYDKNLKLIKTMSAEEYEQSN